VPSPHRQCACVTLEDGPRESPRGGFPQIRTWEEPGLRSPGGGREYGDMIVALRSFLDAVAAAAPDVATTVGLAADLTPGPRS